MSGRSAVKKLVLSFVVTSLVLAVLLWVAVRLICAKYGDGFQIPLFAGGAAGWLVNLLALPFGLMLARVPQSDSQGGGFWVLWGAGFLARLLGISVFAFALNWFFEGRQLPALMAMMAIFLPGMFVESAWLGKQFFAMDKKTGT